MGIIKSFTEFFKETKADIREEINDLKKTEKKLKEKLKNFTIKEKPGFFDDTKEDINEELEEIKSTIEELKKKLLKKPKKKNPKSIWPYIFIIVIGLLIWWYYRPAADTTQDRCSEFDDSIGCITISAPKGNIHDITFDAKNIYTETRDCSIKYILKRNNVVIAQRTFSIGSYAPQEIRSNTIQVEMPQGESDIELNVECTI